MREGLKKILEDLGKLLKKWDVISLNAHGILGVLISRWRSNIHLSNHFFLVTRICT